MTYPTNAELKEKIKWKWYGEKMDRDFIQPFFRKSRFLAAMRAKSERDAMRAAAVEGE